MQVTAEYLKNEINNMLSQKEQAAVLIHQAEGAILALQEILAKVEMPDAEP